jgi:hypothetical protein
MVSGEGTCAAFYTAGRKAPTGHPTSVEITAADRSSALNRR